MVSYQNHRAYLVPAVGHLRAKCRHKWRLRSGMRLRALISPVGSPPHRRRTKVRWDCRKAACVRPANQAALTLALLGSHGSHPGFAVPTVGNKEKAGYPYGYPAFWCRRWDSNPHDVAIGGF